MQFWNLSSVKLFEKMFTWKEFQISPLIFEQKKFLDWPSWVSFLLRFRSEVPRNIANPGDWFFESSCDNWKFAAVCRENLIEFSYSLKLLVISKIVQLQRREIVLKNVEAKRNEICFFPEDQCIFSKRKFFNLLNDATRKFVLRLLVF